MHLIITLIFVLLSTVSVFGQEIDPPLATIRLEKTEVIGTNEFEDQIAILEKQSGKTVDDATKKVLLQNLINERIILQAANGENITVTDNEAIQAALGQVAKQTGNNNITEAQLFEYVETTMGLDRDFFIQKMKDQLILQKYIQSKQASTEAAPAEVTEKEIEDFYEANSTNFINPDLIRFKHVFYSTQGKSESEKKVIKQKAEDAHDEIIAKKITFTEAVERDTDDATSKKNGGDVGFIARTEEALVQAFGESFVNTIFSLPLKEVSNVVTSNVGYHIIYVEEKRAKKFLALNDPIRPGVDTTVKAYITQSLTNQKAQGQSQAAIQKIIEDLRADSDIKILNDKYKS